MGGIAFRAKAARHASASTADAALNKWPVMPLVAPPGTLTAPPPQAPAPVLPIGRGTHDDLARAFRCGREQGLAERRTLDINEAVLDALHDQALEMLGMAKRYADVKGPCWSAMVLEAAERDD